MDKTKIAVELFNKLAKLYQDKFMNVDLYGESLNLFCNHIADNNAGILDIACGPGNITKYLLDRRPGFKITGLDLAPNMIELARINNPTADFMLMDSRDVGKLENKYDAVICSFGLPYLSKQDAIRLIDDASKLLKPNGVLYLSTMEDDYNNSGFKKSSTGEEMFIHYHQADYLVEAIEKSGLKIPYLKRQDFTEPDGSKTIDLIIISIRNISI